MEYGAKMAIYGTTEEETCKGTCHINCGLICDCMELKILLVYTYSPVSTMSQSALESS